MRFSLRRSRIHGAKRYLVKQADSAHRAAQFASDERAAAALRGKATGLMEGAAVLAALEDDHRLPRRRRDPEESK